MKASLLLMLLITAWLTPFDREALGCNSCHSKNPKMVKMHEALGFENCFKCHGRGVDKTPEGQKAQMISDERCIQCHKK
ncbi:MAG: hypothetical protein ACLPN1_16560 [Dissulfurispiraceae bacterium]